MVAYCCIVDSSLLATCLRCLDINAPNTLRISQISVWIYEKNPFRVNLTILQKKNHCYARNVGVLTNMKVLKNVAYILM